MPASRSLLEQIKQPGDLRNIPLADLEPLARQVRERIVQVMSKNGGHLASNLGSVELTLALHYVFNSPIDKFIFDVSHQTYTHKLLTGRNDERFDKIRKSKGLSGFAHPKESPHDFFYAGHAGTALSLGLGMAEARDLNSKEGHIIPVIGDATLTCGLSLEALSNLPKDLSKFIVILNDNAMSISRNVGGITNILSRLLSNPTTNKYRHEFETLLSKIPLCGAALAKKGHKLSESVKNLVSSAPFFEHFGLSYIGPIDGHDIKKMIAVFEALKHYQMPVIVHLYTQKGHGLTAAENDPITFHGVKPFDPATCEFLPSSSNQPTFPKIFGKHLLKMGEQDSKVAVVTPAMSLGSCLDPFMDKFPNRSWDVGIAEGHAVTFAAGLAKSRELKVFASVYATFLQRALDNLFQDVCLQEIPLVFAVDRAGLAASDGATHHGIYDIGFLKTMPNMVICQPRNGDLLKDLMESSFSWEQPVAIRYPNSATSETQNPRIHRPCGKAEVLTEGDDLLIVALGSCCDLAMKMQANLATQGIMATVIDPIFVKPLDAELFSTLLLKHQKMVTIEEHSLKGGLGSEMSQFLMTHGFSNVQLLQFGVPEHFFDHSDRLLDDVGLNPEKMVQKILTDFSFAEHALVN
jgi:1-deoxy-D-xylulose-5-phosphate synthase